MLRTRGDTLLDVSNVASSQHVDLSLDLIDQMAIQVIYKDATPVAVALPANDGYTITLENGTWSAGPVSAAEKSSFQALAHGFSLGLKVALTSNGSFPTGLSATNYWIIPNGKDGFQLASSLVNAVAGTHVQITADSDYAHGYVFTFTPATLSGVVKLQASNDGINFDDVSSYSATFTASSNKVWNLNDQNYSWSRVLFTPTSGSIDFKVVLNGKTASGGA